MKAICLSGPDCGLCFTRNRNLQPLTARDWRNSLGPVTDCERRGYQLTWQGKEMNDPVPVIRTPRRQVRKPRR